jgi:hypothetical protein
MNWFKRQLFAAQVMPWSLDEAEQSTDDLDYDPYERAQQAEQAFQQSNIHVNRNKNISHVAVENGQVIGAVQSEWSQDTSYGEPVWVFSFDVAVKPEFRGPQMTGLKLISEAIKHYEQTKGQYAEQGAHTMMRLWVVNPRLVPILESRFGMEVESDMGEGGSYLIRY